MRKWKQRSRKLFVAIVYKEFLEARKFKWNSLQNNKNKKRREKRKLHASRVILERIASIVEKKNSVNQVERWWKENEVWQQKNK